MMDDRMPLENMKDLASSLMSQSGSARSPDSGAGKGHPDRRFAASLFGESHELPQSSAGSAGLDLSPLVEAMPGSSVRTLQEDLVSQAAQSLVKNQVDAFLAITQRMNPEEVLLSLKTAREWRRPDENWQETFRSAPESGYKFLDRKPGKPARPNTAERLARQIAAELRESRVDAAYAPQAVRRKFRERGIRVPEQQLVKFAARVAKLV